MSAEPLPPASPDDRIRELSGHIRALMSCEPAELAHLVSSLGLDSSRSVLEAAFAARVSSDLRHSSPARKVSVSIPEDLTKAVQQRAGRGKFSQYVTEAVVRQLEMDLLADLSESLTAEYGPVPEQDLAEAQAAWPDAG
jgi:Arc/MetJ-type ribon-helix-helix transcriptional regulator